MAIRYDYQTMTIKQSSREETGTGIGWVCSKAKVVHAPSEATWTRLLALITADKAAGTVTWALYVAFTAGVSWQGSMVRAWIA